MSPHSDDLTGMKDDMTAFIEGLGMRRFFGYVECEEVPSVLWDSGQNPDGWKDFVELAKSTGAPFLMGLPGMRFRLRSRHRLVRPLSAPA